MPLYKNILNKLINKKITVSTAESCTGGLLAYSFTKNKNASTVYIGGYISYSNELKIKDLNIKKKTLNKYGAVSPEIVKEMIDGLKTSIPILMDKYGVAAEKYGALALPTTAIINSKGEIAYIHTGFQLGDEKEIVSILDSSRKVKVED